MKRHLLNSLKVRLILSALLLILILMPLIGVALNNAFKEQAKSAIENELSAYVYSVLAVAEFDSQQLNMPEQLLENRFNVIQSGLYALISTQDPFNQTNNQMESEILWYSDSFLGVKFPDELPHPLTGQSKFAEISLEDKAYLIYSFTASFELAGNQSSQRNEFPITIHIIKDQSDFQQQVKQFSKKLWSWLLILMVFLLVVQFVWLLWTLRPLVKFARELTDIEEGRAQHLDENYPNELQVVAQQLNTLLNTEQTQRKRYRNALSDLAHSLKTPLSVIQSQEGLSQSSVEQVMIINNMIGHQLKRAQTAAGSSWHLGFEVTLVTDKLVRALTKIYQDKPILITANVDSKSIFKGDQADLNEILGNLLDNACKAAKSKVLITVRNTQNKLNIVIEDDGKGINIEKQAMIFERGIRADSYEKGHGIGLAIVRDLVDSYNGELAVSASKELGGAKFTMRF